MLAGKTRTQPKKLLELVTKVYLRFTCFLVSCYHPIQSIQQDFILARKVVGLK